MIELAVVAEQGNPKLKGHDGGTAKSIRVVETMSPTAVQPSSKHWWEDRSVLAGVALFVTMNAVAKGILTLMETIATPMYQVRWVL